MPHSGAGFDGRGRSLGVETVNRKRICVIDDEVAVAERISAGLPDDQFEVFHIPSPTGLIAANDESRFDVVVLDRLIDDGDVVDGIADWRMQGLDTPLLVLSSLASTSDRLEGLNAGADAYMTKPFEVAEVT